MEESTTLDKSSVFIVHGHDNLAKEEVARFVEKLKLKAIILHEQVSSGKTIIEKIEEYSDVGFAIVLYTPCDVGSQKDKKEQLKLRARQNVVFEHGFLMGKIGRKNVCALVKDKVETPNDISGVVYLPMDYHKAWQIAIAKEMRNAGYKIDMNIVV
ncbi:nucleotide-binding protein [Salegentibacter sp. JZCK2]|uniref:TIR domain-containing protein n=1 Tax=Salegentibacter tibetensis TaxID=2873600 RepID=UPI001CCBBCC3|nr:nucleotide-binding protein [Salegentibacter tibetensis]MBZ9729709.1 nucleotide-binding protein [Salegentibacter tibetensis]